MKIAFPQIRLTLLDSLQKRLKFLQEVSDKLELGEIQMLHGRAEDYAKQPEFREHFDLCDKIEFQLPGGDMGRTLVVIDKIKKTPKKYPRKAGTPAKMPIV